MFTTKKIRTCRIEQYITQLKSININQYIFNLSPQDLKQLIERAKIHTQSSSQSPASNKFQDQQIIDNIIKIQLNIIIEKKTEAEKQFLQNQNIKIGTYRVQIGEYRKEITKLLDKRHRQLQQKYKIRYKKLRDIINQSLLTAKELQKASATIHDDKELMKLTANMEHIQRDNIISRIAQIALCKMTAGKDIHNYINKQYEETKRRCQENYQLIDTNKYIKISERLLQSANHHDLITGLCALTGRRAIEIVKTGKFEINDEYSMVFTGQAKRRQIDSTPVIIPVLSSPFEIIKAHRKLKTFLLNQDIDWSLETNQRIHNLISSKIFAIKQALFKPIFSIAATSQQEVKIDLRAAYAAICFNIFQPVMSFKAYTAQILNHKDMESADSYAKYKPIGEGEME